MEPRDVGELVSIVRTLYPAQRFDDNPENVMRAWALVIGDLQLNEARHAVVSLARSGAQWCAPGDVRRIVAEDRHVLSPDVDQLLADLREVASRDGVGRKHLHPVAQRVYDAQGGAAAIRQMNAPQLQSVRKSLIEQRERFDKFTLSVGELPPPRPAIATVKRALELEAGQ